MDGKTDVDQDLESPEFSEEELALMTEEERRAVVESGHEDKAAGKEEPDGQEKEDGGQEEGKQWEGLQEVAEGAEGSEAQQEKTVSQPGTFIPFLQMGESGEDIQTKLDELDKQLEEGDIDIVQYTKQRDPLIQQRTEAQLAAKFNQQSSEQLWQYEQKLFFNSHPEYRDDPVLNGAIQRVFKSLDTKENSHRTGFDLLNEALDQVEASLAERFGGVKRPGPEQQQQQAQDQKQEQQQPRAKYSLPKPDKSARERAQLPRTLSDVPAAEANDTAPGEFAHLDNLNGLEFEKALSRLTPDQQERYLRQ